MTTQSACGDQAQPADPWPTTEFVLIEATPSIDIIDEYLINPIQENVFNELDDNPFTAEIENHFHRVALEYQRMGFRAPNLRIKDGKYVAYVFDFSADMDTYARAYCFNGLPSDIRLDKKNIVGKNGPEPRLWDDIAHELFHIIQYQYTNCGLDAGKFFIEGSAQAVGEDMAYKLRGVEKPRNLLSRWGARRYDVPLYTTPFTGPGLSTKQAITNKDHEYATASFWRYLGEYAAASGRPSVNEITPDYTFFHTLMSQKLASDREADIIAWLNQGVKKSLGIGLERAYSDFISTFAGFTEGGRYTFVTSTPEQVRDIFLSRVFTSCQSMTIDLSGNTSATTAFDIQPIAAGCLKADFTASMETDIDFNVRGPDKERLKNIKIGTLGGERVTGPIGEPQPSPTGGGYIATWRFHVKTDAPKFFILSNVAHDPTKSASYQFDIFGAVTGFFNSLSPAPAPSPQNHPSRPKKPAANRASTAPGVEDNIRESAEEQHANDVKSLSNMTATSVTLKHNDSVSSVCPEPFRFEPCRPNTTIRMELRPGSFGDMQSARGPGGLFAQAMYAAQAVEDYGITQTLEDLAVAKREADKIEGRSIEIILPRIQFGFTGTFDNASMHVSGVESVMYQAIGPRDALPGGEVGFELSGRVSIEEYTPLMLRGRFSAQLVDRAAVDITGQKDPVLPVARTIEGWFSISSPYQHEEGYKFELPSGDELADMFSQDAVQTAPGMKDWVRNMVDAEARKAAQQASPDAADAPYSPVSAFPSCMCGCDEVDTQSAICKPICLSKTKLCAKPYGRDYKSERAKSTSNESARLREKLLAHMAAKNVKLSLREFYLAEFDNAPNTDAQRLLLRSLKIPIDD